VVVLAIICRSEDSIGVVAAVMFGDELVVHLISNLARKNGQMSQWCEGGHLGGSNRCSYKQDIVCWTAVEGSK